MRIDSSLAKDADRSEAIRRRPIKVLEDVRSRVAQEAAGLDGSGPRGGRKTEGWPTGKNG